MNINLTLFAQSVAFALFAWICWRFIWPVIINAMEERRARIEQGLNDAADAEKALANSKKAAASELHRARQRGDDIVKKSQEHALELENDARDKSKRIVNAAADDGKKEAERLVQESARQLRDHFTALVYEGVEKITQKSADRKLHDKLVEELIRKL